MLPRHLKSKNTGRRTHIKKPRAWTGLRPKALEGLAEKIHQKFHWTHTPREFQLEAIRAQLLRKDVLVHAGTGSGKTTIAAGPHALIDKAVGMVTFMISPLIALQEEQVTTFQKEFGLSAIAVNSIHGGCTKEIMAKICAGEWQIILISPEIILSSTFISEVFHNPAMLPRILSVIVDEVHVVSHWGASFRKEYVRIGMLRAHLPKGTPIVAMSTTLSARIRRDVVQKLQFSEGYISLDIGNDRTNVSIIVRSMHNPMNTFSDLDFVIPSEVKTASDIPKTMIYCDQINAEVGVETRLDERLPQSMRNTGLIRPYSAAFTAEHRATVMDLFKEGVVRLLVCTDAAGMGCNVLDVDVVVQWKLPATVSTFVQRAGRAARDPTRSGLAVLLVEKTTYDADLSRLEAASVWSGEKGKGIRQSSTYLKGPKGYAIRHGIQRGSANGLNDENPLKDGEDVPLDGNSLDEGLYTLVQTGVCRRKVLTRIYNNDPPVPTVACCDLCNPTLLDRTRPGHNDAAMRTVTLKTGLVNNRVRLALQHWRCQIYERDFEDAVFGVSAILTDDRVDKLSSVGEIVALNRLEAVVGMDWPWFDPYGDELLEELIKLKIEPMVPKNPKARAEKRSAGQPELDEGRDSRGPPAKKTRMTQVRTVPTSTRFESPTPVVHGNSAASTSQTPSTPLAAMPVFAQYGAPVTTAPSPAIGRSMSMPMYHATPAFHTPYYHPSMTRIPQNPYSGMLQYPYSMPAHYPLYQTPPNHSAYPSYLYDPARNVELPRNPGDYNHHVDRNIPK